MLTYSLFIIYIRYFLPHCDQQQQEYSVYNLIAVWIVKNLIEYFDHKGSNTILRVAVSEFHALVLLVCAKEE